MHEKKHTPEPWQWSRSASRSEQERGHNFYIGGPSDNGGQSWPAVGATVKQEDADRIVACVNACAGIADPSVVPDLVAALDRIADYFGPEHEWDTDETAALRDITHAALARVCGEG